MSEHWNCRRSRLQLNTITMSDRIIHDQNHDGLDRRGFLQCMALGESMKKWVQHCAEWGNI